MSDLIPFEVIIGEDAVAAESYAMGKLWRIPYQSRRKFYRSVAGEPAYEIEIRYVATPAELARVPYGTLMHVAPFKLGMPAAWARAAAHLRAAVDLRDMPVGQTLPMCDAPDDRPIMIFDGQRLEWTIALWATSVDGRTGWFISNGSSSALRMARDRIQWPVGWMERPGAPPEILINAVMGELAAEAAQGSPETS